MKKSFTYYLTLWVIKIKGIKKSFSQIPIDYIKLRKDDVHNPKNKFFKQQSSTFSVLDTTVTEIRISDSSNQLLIYIHGGAFVSGPAQHHWDSLEKIAKKTKQIIWMCDYPKSPEYKIDTISHNIDSVYELALSKFKRAEISLMGDSVGGTLTVALTQRILKKRSSVPKKLLLISPVMDASLTNPKIDAIDKKDPMLSKKGVLSAKKMCAGDNLKDENISPIYGNFDGFPKTLLFIAENDITFPDQQKLCKKLQSSGIENVIVIGSGMPHIWPLLPVMKESRIALDQIITELNT